MKNASKLKLCDWALLPVMSLILASGIQLEVTGGAERWAVWVHIALGLVLMALAIWHVYLHYRRSNWFARFSRNRHVATKILWWLFVVTALTGIAAMIHWFDGYSHSPLGGVHGKLGFAMAIVAVLHVVRYFGFYRKSI
jgi:hypothetical protein